MTDPQPEPVLPGRVRLADGNQLRLAETGQRAIARLVDVAAAASIALLCWVVGARLALRSADTDAGELGADGVRTVVLGLVLAVVLVVVYEVVLTARWGMTIGKRIVGIRVVSATDGGRPGWSKALRRWLIPAVSNIVCGLGIAVYLTPLLDRERRQGWHDLAAGTLVVTRR